LRAIAHSARSSAARRRRQVRIAVRVPRARSSARAGPQYRLGGGVGVDLFPEGRAPDPNMGSDLEDLLALFPETACLAADGTLVVGGRQPNAAATGIRTPAYACHVEPLPGRAPPYPE